MPSPPLSNPDLRPWDPPVLDNRSPRSLKQRYEASVSSTLARGNEAWTLTPRALATLRGFPATTPLHREVVSRGGDKPSYDLLPAVGRPGHQWLGHIPRMHADRLVRRADLPSRRLNTPLLQIQEITTSWLERGMAPLVKFTSPTNSDWTMKAIIQK